MKSKDVGAIIYLIQVKLVAVDSQSSETRIRSRQHLEQAKGVGNGCEIQLLCLYINETLDC